MTASFPASPMGERDSGQGTSLKARPRYDYLRVTFDPYLTVAIDRYTTSAGVVGFRARAEVTPGELDEVVVVGATVRDALLAVVERLGDLSV